MEDVTLDSIRTRLGSEFREVRLKNGISQEEIAEKAGVARKTINAFENGHFWLVMKQFLPICKAYGINPFNKQWSWLCELDSNS